MRARTPFRPSRRRACRKRNRTFRPLLEQLEVRMLLTSGHFVEDFSSDVDPSQPGFADPAAVPGFRHAGTAGMISGSHEWFQFSYSNPHLVTFVVGANEFVDEASVAVSTRFGDGYVAFVGAQGLLCYESPGVGICAEPHPLPSIGSPDWVVVSASQSGIGDITEIRLGGGEILFDDVTMHVNDGQQATTVSWAVDADGFWDDAANWSTGNVPGPDDDVVIDRPAGDFTITYRQGNSTVKSVASSEAMIVSGGELEVTSTIDMDASAMLLGGMLSGGSITAGTTINLAGGILSRANALIGSTIQGTPAGGTLDRATVAGILNLTEPDARATVTGGLTLDGTVRIGDDAAGFGALEFAGTQAVTGMGEVVFGGGLDSSRNAMWLTEPGTTLTIGAGITVRGQAGRLGANPNLGTTDIHLINHGTISVGELQTQITSFTDHGALGFSGSLDVDFALIVDEPGRVTGGNFSLTGHLLGNTRNAERYTPSGALQLNGNGTASEPQLFEAMSEDRGLDSVVGYVENFAYGELELASGTYVRLVVQADNAGAARAEAVYVHSLVVPAGTTLDLNGLHLYARLTQISGTIVGGRIEQVADREVISRGVTSQGELVTGELDEWSFFGRAGSSITVLVNPGSGGFAAADPPPIQWVEVRLVDAAGNTVAQAANTMSGEIVTLNDITLVSDGDYQIQVRVAASHSGGGHYSVTLWDSAVELANLVLNHRVTNRVDQPYEVDHWHFAAVAGQQVQFDLVNASRSMGFRLTGPDDVTVFDNQTVDSGMFTLPASGDYILSAYGLTGQSANYAFLLVAPHVDLALNTTYQGFFAGSSQTDLFRVELSEATPLHVLLDDSSSDRHNELYVRHGAPPTRSDYLYRFSTPLAADQELTVPKAGPGSWYILVYSEAGSTPSNYTLRASAAQMILTSLTPTQHGDSADTVLTLSGAGFDRVVSVELVAASGTTFEAIAVETPSQDRLTARLAAGSVPPGVYSVRVQQSSGATAQLTDAFTMIPGGAPRLETNLVLPSWLAVHVIPAEIYVEYANVGEVAMPAPVLVLHASDRAFMTLDRTLVTGGFFTSIRPDGFSDTVQILASGNTPGLLQPGESFRVPVYWAGIQHDPAEPSPVDFTLTVSTVDQTEPIDWSVLQDSIRPAHIAPDVWEPIHANLMAQVGSTWGDYIRMLNDNAAYLGRLGQRVYDVSQLFAFELFQAMGLSPIRALAVSVDASVETPGLTLSFSKSYSNSILGRSEIGVFGHGWHTPWEEHLIVQPDGVVYITGPAATQRRFQPNRRGPFHPNVYTAEVGDRGNLTADGTGGYLLREADGLLRHFLADGKIDFLEDLNGNRITAGYAGSLLTRLTHSSGQYLDIAYNPAGRIESITDSDGEWTKYTYEEEQALNLASQEFSSERTVDFTYTEVTSVEFPTLSASTALDSIFDDSSGIRRNFAYDSFGRLVRSSVTDRSGDDESSAVEFKYDSAGEVAITDAVGGTNKIFFDHRGLIVQVEDALARKARLTHDNQFNVTRYTDAAGLSVHYGYDSKGNLIRVTDELGHATQFGYGQFVAGVGTDRLTSVADAKGNTTSFVYDTRANRTATIYPNSAAESATYDSLGNVESFTSRRGLPISFSHNAAGQVLRKTYADGSHVDAIYDARGNLEALTDETGSMHFQYDIGNRMIRVEYPNGRFLKYTYDAAGRRIRMVDHDGFTVNYEHDEVGRLAQLTDSSGGVIVKYTYDAIGRIERKDLGGGGFTTYEYDAASQLLHLINQGPDGSIHSRFDYTYDVLGRRTMMSTLDGDWTYQYDATGQLVHAAFDSTNAAIADQDLNYEYDAAGNRIRTIINGVTTDYATNNLNQYTQVGDSRYEYDADGNLLSITNGGGTFSFTYDDDSRLTAVATATDAWAYEYDAQGNREAVTHNGMRTEYLIDPTGLGDVVGEYGGGMAMRYVHAFGLIGMYGVIGPCEYEFDGLGNVVGMTDPDGTVHNRYVYAPFGERLLADEAMMNPFQFVGEFGVMHDGVMHENNGLEFMRARFYSTESGRFTSPDPIGFAGGSLNLFTYVSNDPIQGIDPTGYIYRFIDGKWVYFATEQELEEFEKAADAREKQKYSGKRSPLGAPQGPNNPRDKDGTLVPYDPDSHTYRPSPDANPVFPPPPYQGPGIIPFVLPGRGVLLIPGPGSIPILPGARRGAAEVGSVASADPNAKSGPAGFGTANYLRGDSLLSYRIDFENETTATAPAQRVDLFDQLSADLDWSTLEFTEVGFDDTFIPVPAGSRYFFTTLDMNFNNTDFEVEIELQFESVTGQILASFRSLDPATGLPPDVMTGFLPPEDGTGRGQGHLHFIVRPRAGLPTGTEIRNVALIQFDFGETIATNQVDPHDPSQGVDPAKEALITIDTGQPSSSIEPLPAITGTSTFSVHWSGADDAHGSGIAFFDVFVSEDGGPFAPFQFGTLSTTAMFTGEDHRTYRFYSIATDNVGHRQATPANPQASTTLSLNAPVAPPQVLSVVINDGNTQRSMVSSITVTFSELVTIAPGAIELVRQNGSSVGLTLVTSIRNGTTVVVLTFSGPGIIGGSLADGRYALILHSDRIRNGLKQTLDGNRDGVAGDDFRDEFFRLFGDSDGDGDVDDADRDRFRSSFKKRLGDAGFLGFFDFDADGNVAGYDNGQFNRRRGKTP